MPFPAGIDITPFGAEIIARDIDITTVTIDFGTDSPLFDIVNQGTVDDLKKNHRATLVTKSSLDIIESFHFEITASVSISTKNC